MRKVAGRFTPSGVWAVMSVAAVAVATLVVVLGSGSSGPRELRAALIKQCPRGFVQEDDPSSCSRLGHAESTADQLTASTQLGARDTAPFVTGTPGAYAHALAQRAAIERSSRAHAASGTQNAWTLAGHPPECGQATANGVCPAASAANGNYAGIGTLGFRTLSGRISSIAYDPVNTNRIFVSPVVGGVWESVDAGQSFHSIGDQLPTQVVGAIAYDSPLRRVLAGTGDNSYGGSGIAGHGLFYTDDDGATWKPASGIPDLSLSFKVLVSPADPSGDTVYAATSQGLFRSTDGGASFVNEKLPTSPSGYSPNCAGVTAASPGGTISHLCFFANDVTDVVVKPKASSNGPAGAVIAAVGWRAGQKQDLDASGNPLQSCSQGGTATVCLQAPQNGLYQSSTGAPGSFSYITPSGNSPQGLPDTRIIGRTALAGTTGAGENPDAIYALMEDAQKFNGCPDVLDQVPPACQSTVTGEAIATVLNGLFVSYDFGKSWTKIMDSNQLKDPGTNSSLLGQPGYGPGVQAWYNLWVAADPVNHDSSGDPTRVLFGLEEIWENNQVLNNVASGGSQGSVLATPYPAFPGGSAATDPWVVIGRYWDACGAVSPPIPVSVTCNGTEPIAGTTTHPDQHAAAMIPDGKGGLSLYTGSDGGMFTQHIAAGADFNNDGWGDGLNKTISAIQPYDAEMAKDGTVVSGLQDNGELKISPNGAETEVFGGDAFFNTIDPSNSNNIIEEYTYGAMSVTNDGGGNWFNIAPSACAAGNALFATPIEQDPTMAGHLMVGCTQIQEATNAYANPCAAPPGDGNATTCQATNSPFATVYDLSKLPSPNGATNVPSAVGLHGPDAYVAYCGYCDPATQKVPFANGIATNVGGSAAPKIGSGDGWHQAAALCPGCGTANGKLPERYINSIQSDPGNPSTVYVTLGGYGRRWIPPGSFGEDVSNVGVGHVFVSHDHGEHFTNITGNLPDISANWTTFHNGYLVVATDLGVYVSDKPIDAGGTPTYDQLGTNLPAAPVFTVRNDPADANKLLISTYGRGDWLYDFGTAASTPGASGSGKRGNICPAPSGSLSGTHLGPFGLGMTRSAARAVFGRWHILGDGFDDFCLHGGTGIRVGYASRRQTGRLSSRLQTALNGRVVIAMSSNTRYRYRGIHAGMPVKAALKILGRKRTGPFAVGVNRWYALRIRGVVILVKTKAGTVREVGIANVALAGNRKAQRKLLTTLGA